MLRYSIQTGFIILYQKNNSGTWWKYNDKKENWMVVKLVGLKQRQENNTQLLFVFLEDGGILLYN